jgi:hypothetical protein
MADNVREEILARFAQLPVSVDTDQLVVDTISRLVDSILRSAFSGDDRGDFAKGREQMAMHSIALLVGSDWKTIERILFGDDNGNGQESSEVPPNKG